MMMLVIVLMRRGNYGGVEKEHKSGEIYKILEKN